MHNRNKTRIFETENAKNRNNINTGKGYLKVSAVAEKWGLSTQHVRILCNEGRIAGVIRKGNLYMIPANAVQQRDARTYVKFVVIYYLCGVINWDMWTRHT